MKVAITGAGGYIGKAVVAEALARGLQVVAIDRRASASLPSHPGLKTSICDTGDVEALQRAFEGVDAVIHLAILRAGTASEAIVHNSNVVGSFNVLHAAAQCGIRRLCMGSSIAAFHVPLGKPPRFLYFPVDEMHPSFCEDAYGLSKRIGEMQAGAFARQYPEMTIASLRFHWLTEDVETPRKAYRRLMRGMESLWSYTPMALAVRACMQALDADFRGHEIIDVCPLETAVEVPSLGLARRFFPRVPLRRELPGNASFFDNSKAARLLRLFD